MKMFFFKIAINILGVGRVLRMAAKYLAKKIKEYMGMD